MSHTQKGPSGSDEVTGHMFISDAAEDAKREEIRMYEATPMSGEPAQVAQAQKIVDASLAGTSSASPRTAPKRQDFSNEKTSKRDTRIGSYFLGQTLGEGEFGKVKMGWKKDGIRVAVKLIRRDKLDNEARFSKVMREIDILKRLDHANIVKLHETVETDRTIGIVLEYASGGELFDHILHERYLKDPEARRLFSQLVSGVGYLHQHGIIHRDLKLENLLLDRNNNIIITDFGFANTFDPIDELGDKIEAKLHRRSFVKRHRLDEVDIKSGFRRGDLMATSCGSPCYAAPELVVSDGIYTGRKVDVWSCGVILYAMLAGYLPFDDDPANPDGDNINLLYKYIVSAPLVFPEHVTPHARDMLRRILVPDPRNRADLFEVARHSWLADYFYVVEKFTTKTAQPDMQAAAAAAAVEMHSARASGIGRSASVREAAKPHAQASPIGGLISKQGKVSRSPDVDKAKAAKDAKRRTVQIEYVAPQSQTTRGGYDSAMSAADPNVAGRGASPRVKGGSSIPVPIQSPAPSSKSTRPARDVPRSISDSTAFNLGNSSTIRPVTTQGAISSSSKLPQRGSYGQPAAATVAAETAQGRFSQPPPSRQSTSEAFARPQTARRPVGDAEGRRSNRNSAIYPTTTTESTEKSHRRQSTLSNFSERLFGRRNSSSSQRPGTAQKEKSDSGRARPPTSGGKDRRYPPSSHRPLEPELAPKQSSESSRRSFGFSRKSVDINRDPSKRNSKRFSLIPRLGSSHGKDTSSRPQTSDAAMMLRPGTAGTYDGAGPQQPEQWRSVQPPSRPSAPTQYSSNRHSTYLEPTYEQSPPRASYSQSTNTAAPNQSSQRVTSGGSQAPPRSSMAYDARQDLSSSYSTAQQSTQDYSAADKLRAEKAYNRQSKPSAAGRVMDFFKRRRHERTGYA